MARPLRLGLLLLLLGGLFAAGRLFPCGLAADLTRLGGRAEACGREMARRRAEDPAAGALASPLAPEAVLPRAEALAGSWEAIEEVPADPHRDPQLRRWGVRALRTRHYAQRGAAAGSSRVCSVEVWVFGDAHGARAARADYAPSGWRVEREGRLLVFARGVTLTLGEPLERGLFPACLGIADRARATGARLLRERVAPPGS